MPREHFPNVLTKREKKNVMSLLSDMDDAEIARELGLQPGAITRYRRYVETENSCGTKLTVTPLDHTVWLLSQREDLTETQEEFLQIYQSETLAIMQRSWCETERQVRAGSLTAIEAMRSREVYPQRVAWAEIYGRNGIPS